MNVALANQIEGWMSEGELRFLSAHASKSRVVLEAGSYQGRSTRAMADNTKGVVHAIDPWSVSGYRGYENPRDIACGEYCKGEGDNIYEAFKKNLDEHLKSGRVVPHRQEFHTFRIDSPDMIFIDACHEYSRVLRDIHHAIFLLLGNGGFLCGHDYSGNWPEVIKAVDEIFGNDVKHTESIWWINL